MNLHKYDSEVFTNHGQDEKQNEGARTEAQ